MLFKIYSKIRVWFRLHYARLGRFRFHIGKNAYVGKGIWISRKNDIVIGNNFFIGNYGHLASNLKIGNDVMIASHVAFVGGDHDIKDKNVLMRLSGRAEMLTTILEDNVWVGHGVIVMHGVKISYGSVVAAGSVVTKNIPPFEVWGGVPAKFLRSR